MSTCEWTCYVTESDTLPSGGAKTQQNVPNLQFLTGLITLLIIFFGATPDTAVFGLVVARLEDLLGAAVAVTTNIIKKQY